MASSARAPVAIVGAGHSNIHRRGEESLAALTMQACEAALADAGLSFDDIDGLATYPKGPYAGAGSTQGVEIAGIDFALSRFSLPRLRWYAEVQTGMIVSAVIEGMHAIRAGACDFVLLWRSLHNPAGSYGSYSGPSASGDAQFAAPHGLVSIVQWHALAYSRYIHLYGATRDSMAELVTQQRKNAAANPHAFFRDKPLSKDQYLASRMISTPLGLLDCDLPVQGSTAIVLARADVARKNWPSSALITGYAQNLAPGSPSLHYTLDDYYDVGRELARQLWSAAGRGPADVDVAQLYDGFSPTAYYWLEGLGFCERGQAHEFVADGQVRPDGSLPVNTFGGSLSEGRLHGMGHIIEAARQVTNRAGDRQIPGAAISVATTGSPLLRSGALVIERS